MAPLAEFMRNSGAKYGYEWALQGGLLRLASSAARMASSAGDDDGIVYSEMSATATFSPGEGCVGKAFATKEAIVINDVSAATSDFLRKHGALEDGLRSIAFLPWGDSVLELCFSKPLRQADGRHGMDQNALPSPQSEELHLLPNGQLASPGWMERLKELDTQEGWELEKQHVGRRSSRAGRPTAARLPQRESSGCCLAGLKALLGVGSSV